MPAIAPRHRPDCDAPVSPLPAHLNKLRVLAASCRAQARLDLFRACDMLARDDHMAAEAYASALMRTLGQALGRRPAIRTPGSPPSFDESWLMRLIERAHARDDDSLAFLILRRIPAAHRHSFLHLINGLARRLDVL